MMPDGFNYPNTRRIFRPGDYIGKLALLGGLVLPLPADAQKKLAEDRQGWPRGSARNIRMTFMTVGLGTKGPEDYSSYSFVAGPSYHLSERDTVSAFATYVDNTFGEEVKLTIGYRREF